MEEWACQRDCKKPAVGEKAITMGILQITEMAVVMMTRAAATEEEGGIMKWWKGPRLTCRTQQQGIGCAAFQNDDEAEARIYAMVRDWTIRPI